MRGSRLFQSITAKIGRSRWRWNVLIDGQGIDGGTARGQVEARAMARKAQRMYLRDHRGQSLTIKGHESDYHRR